MKLMIWIAAAACLASPADGAAQGRSNTRFEGMDTNRDGVITRQEWRGNDRSFRNHDWNGDGRLSGDEIRVGAQRANGWDDHDIESSIARENDWSPERFRALDHNNDGRLARNEWHAAPELFTRIDRNRDNFLSAREFAIEGDDDREDQFADLDANRDGRVTRAEWHGSKTVFDALDANRDGSLTRPEAVGTGTGGSDEFASMDVNTDRVVSRNEWHWNTAAFDRLDANHDNQLTRQEFDNSAATVPNQSEAYRAGYARGQQDGVQAGREDKPRGWDLEGQRELEGANAGYEGRLGSLSEYQSGYRAGFRRGYREGFGPR
jgi:hypothetical protein